MINFVGEHAAQILGASRTRTTFTISGISGNSSQTIGYALLKLSTLNHLEYSISAPFLHLRQDLSCFSQSLTCTRSTCKNEALNTW